MFEISGKIICAKIVKAVQTVHIKKSANNNFSFQTFVKELFLLKQTFDVKRSTHEKKLTSKKRKKSGVV